MCKPVIALEATIIPNHALERERERESCPLLCTKFQYALDETSCMWGNANFLDGFYVRLLVRSPTWEGV